jgi:hypothetical protein
MRNRSLRTILGQPALHILVALGFAVAFSWPIFVLTEPRQTFYFLYLAWSSAILASLALSRGQPPEPTREAAGGRATPEQQPARGAEEAS